MRARITAKSSAARGRVTFPPLGFCRAGSSHQIGRTPASCSPSLQPRSTSTGYRSTSNGIRALRVDTTGTQIELPKFRGLNGEWQAAIILPEEVRGPIGDAVLDELVERGLAKRRFALPMPVK